MTGIAQWIAGFGVAKVGQVGHGVATLLATYDPETASQVDIDNMRAEFTKLGQELSKAESNDQQAADEVTRLEGVLARDKQAALVLGQQLQTTSEGTPEWTKKDGALNALLNVIEQLGGPSGDGTQSGTLFDARKRHASTETIKHQIEQLHAGAAAALRQSEQVRQQAKADMESARLAEQQAKQQQQQAEELAGISHRLADGSNSVALHAMQAQAAQSQQRARAMQLNAEALTAAGPTSVEAIVDEALQTSTARPSALDRLRAITGNS